MSDEAQAGYRPGYYIERADRKGRRRPPPLIPRPRCNACGKPLRRSPYWVEGRGGGSWGDYGDNVLCGVTCGYRFALRMLERLARRAL